jgi:hypothetical protein
LRKILFAHEDKHSAKGIVHFVKLNTINKTKLGSKPVAYAANEFRFFLLEKLLGDPRARVEGNMKG